MKPWKTKKRDQKELCFILPPGTDFWQREGRVNDICVWLEWIEDPTTEPAVTAVLNKLVSAADPEELEDAQERRQVASVPILCLPSFPH